MFDKQVLDKSSELHRKWEDAVKRTIAKHPDQKENWTTVSDQQIKRIYGPEDIKDMNFEKDISYPGQYPFLRGNQPTGYRGKYWTFRMFSGMGTAIETNERWHYLLSTGQTGLSTAFDFPTLMGYDSDSPKARGEVGKCGVAIDTIADFQDLIKGIPLDKISTSMTINPPATVLWAMYCASAQMQNVPLTKISGTIQNDMLKEFIAQKTFMCPPEPSVKLISDTVEFGTKYVPRWNTISISGYHIREAGSTAVQELAFTLRDGVEYVEDAINRKGLNVDDFAPRLSFFFNSHIDFFEEIAKMRAARRMWAKIMKERFKAKNPRSLWMRFHTQTAGCSLTAQQPYNNVVRTAVEALAAVMGGTQSLHTNSLDEVLCLPSEQAVQIALRTQQILAEETGVANTTDPLAGSYFVEALTNKMEKEAWDYINKIDEMGGMVAAIEKGFPQMEISDAAYKFQQQIDAKKKVVVGVNKYVEENEKVDIPMVEIDESVEKEQLKRLADVKRQRDGRQVSKCLKDLESACKKGENVMPYCIEAVKAYATVEEICNVYRDVYGEYRDPGIY
ncbi:MAG: methylmalonyl-CoA mutase family protein [Clostridium luticellarii]|uniref:Methylmalonyl-CoA mutase large subunit n=1 Tax=Clostridium luticellarii TaxID=1691940 RepID=A0A2T0BSB1_9CLOT|nr:methylmalonyl-CoA mutase family protein [Clostridium luticellarii]MCI1945557.1 methylmalonyl-CoA mutase family protein [Clostridium luticellarii]MCI1968884.1 methylmalonyl-CoA mutase family protein [Clostridium luticellarii]MCI1996501.1 methylmalonyl-CoA mutase family protein [Clostridium luticellarii]MCI2041057.1 methylmalonyl-CoA mutase family protein [Clostridium luticellarii]PRR86788.1 Methylmalonyl-CoA mutase large subunit [Clostridium luticellarii]